MLLVLAAASAASGIKRALKLPKPMWQSHVQDLGLETYPKMSPHLCGHIGSAQQQQGDADDDPRGRAPRQLRELKSPPGGFQGGGEAAELHPAGLAGQGDSHIAGGHAGLHTAQVSRHVCRGYEMAKGGSKGQLHYRGAAGFSMRRISRPGGSAHRWAARRSAQGLYIQGCRGRGAEGVTLARERDVEGVTLDLVVQVEHAMGDVCMAGRHVDLHRSPLC